MTEGVVEEIHVVAGRSIAARVRPARLVARCCEFETAPHTSSMFSNSSAAITSVLKILLESWSVTLSKRLVSSAMSRTPLLHGRLHAIDAEADSMALFISLADAGERLPAALLAAHRVDAPCSASPNFASAASSPALACPWRIDRGDAGARTEDEALGERVRAQRFAPFSDTQAVSPAAKSPETPLALPSMSTSTPPIM